MSWQDKQKLSRNRDAATVAGGGQKQGLTDYLTGQRTKFLLEEDPRIAKGAASNTGLKLSEQGTVQFDSLAPYSDFVGNRFPTLSTAKNWR